jgi:hypothetical protein
VRRGSGFAWRPLRKTTSSGPAGRSLSSLSDTEDEARQIASKYDAFGRDWRDPLFAACDSLETSETHVFGDVVFRSEPVVVEGGKRAAKRR